MRRLAHVGSSGGSLLANDALATKVNLKKRKIVNEVACPTCLQDGETIIHIFKDCSFTRAIWWSLLGVRSTNINITTVQDWLKVLL